MIKKEKIIGILYQTQNRCGLWDLRREDDEPGRKKIFSDLYLFGGILSVASVFLAL